MVRPLQHPIVSPDPFIWVRDYALDPRFCEHVIEKFQNDENAIQGVCGSDRTVQMIKSSRDLLIDSYDYWLDEQLTFRNVLRVALQEYVNHIQSHIVLPTFDHNDQLPYAQFECCHGHMIDYGFQIQETKPYGSYDWHDDSFITWDSRHVRKLTYIFYLNDIFDDGCTEFMNGFKVPPRQGRLVIFPATWTYMHRGGILHGTHNKYIATGWMNRDYSDPEEAAPKQDVELKDEDINELLLDYEPPLEGELTLDELTLK